LSTDSVVTTLGALFCMAMKYAVFRDLTGR
jgi:hypothetical protein